jgi:drug/metabolite transporter (DMT)-like permease
MKRLSQGLGSMMVGYGLLGCVPILVRLSRDYGYLSAEVVFIRFSIGALLTLAMAKALGVEFKTGQPGLLIARGLLGAIAVQLYFASIQLSGAAVGTLLNYTYPVWANLFGAFVGHRPSGATWFLAALALIGMFFIVDPLLSAFSLGEALGVLSAVIAGAAVVSIKKLRDTDGELTILLSFCILGAVIALPFALVQFSEAHQARSTIGLRAPAIASLLGVGVLSFLGQFFFTRGYKLTSIQVGSVLSFSVPLIATLLGVLLLGEPVTVQLLLGASCILTSCLLVGRI